MAVADTNAEIDFAKYVKEKNAAIEQALSDSVPTIYPERLHESMRYSLLAGGKRIRPCLAIAAMIGWFEDSSASRAVGWELKRR